MSQKSKTHKLTVTAMLSAVAFVLQMLEFPMPFFVPPFIKMDFSELPALLAAFSLGPICGAWVCLLKNLFMLLRTQSAGVGELCNFLIGLCFVVPAGWLYRTHKTRRVALTASLFGAILMALISVPINYYLSYPIYAKLMPLDVIIGMYQSLRPSVNGLLECLLIFNLPFTLVKGLLDVGLCFLIYKPLSPLLHR